MNASTTQCTGCFATFTYHGYFQHVAKTQNVRCQMTHIASQSRLASPSIQGVTPLGLNTSSVPADEGEFANLHVIVSLILTF